MSLPSDTGPLLPPVLRGVRAAFVFFTRLPVGGFPYRDADWKWAPAHAPIVGLVLGGALGQLGRGLMPLGPLPAALIVIGASLLLTGALHEDGLADTTDALGGAHDPARVHVILKDSRMGVFGGAALVVSIVGRASLLAQVGESIVWALPLAACAARVGPVGLMASLPYVTPPDSAKSREVTRSGAAQLAVAVLWLAGVVVALVRGNYLSTERASVLVGAVGAVTVLSGLRYRARVGGLTGDFLGATEQLGELAALAVLAWKA